MHHILLCPFAYLRHNVVLCPILPRMPATALSPHPRRHPEQGGLSSLAALAFLAAVRGDRADVVGGENTGVRTWP